MSPLLARTIARIVARLAIRPSIDVAQVRRLTRDLEDAAAAGSAAAMASCPRPACTHRWELVALQAFRRDYVCRLCEVRFISGAILNVDEDGFESRIWPRPPR